MDRAEDIENFKEMFRRLQIGTIFFFVKLELWIIWFWSQLNINVL